MGRGPSISEFLEPYMSAIFQLGMVGMIGLLLTAMYWWRVESGKKPDRRGMIRSKLVQLSFVLVPSLSMLMYFIAKVSLF